MDRRDAYPALLLDYASGTLDDATFLIAETHVRMSAEARNTMRALDALGGALLEAADDEAPSVIEITRRSFEPSHASTQRIAAARALVSAARESPDDLRWRWRAPALREIALPVAGAALVRMPAGKSVPAHGHTQEELTLVLRGALSDGSGRYGPGDIAFADSDTTHTPTAEGVADCICLTAFGGAWLFRSLTARIVSRLAG